MNQSTMADKVHFKASEGPCEIHDWPNDKLPERLVTAMRERHGKGGINCCRSCIDRAHQVARASRFIGFSADTMSSQSGHLVRFRFTGPV